MGYDYETALAKSTEGRIGKTIFLLGSASTGPTYDLTPLTSQAQVAEIFGGEGSIPEAYKMAATTGLDCDLFAMKVTGTHSSVSLDMNLFGGEVVEDGLVLTSTHSADTANEIIISVEDNKMTISYPAELGGHALTYDFEVLKVMCFLIRAINDDAKSGLGFVRAYSDLPNSTQLFGTLIGVNPAAQSMYGADNGLDWGKAELFNCLGVAYDVIESLKADVVIPLDAFMDDVHPRYVYGVDYYSDDVNYAEDRPYLDYKVNGVGATYHRQLIDFCKKQLQIGVNTHGIMGMNELKDLDALSDPELRVLEGRINASPMGNRLGFSEFNPAKPNSDDGMFVSIVLGDLKLPDESIYNGYVAYAMQFASGVSNLSTTNQPLNDTIEIVHEFTTAELDYLSNKGIVAYRVSPLKGLVVHNGVSAANPKSEYHISCNVRMVQLLMARIKATLDKYIGEPVGKLKDDETIEEEVSSIFEDAVNSNIIKEHAYSIEYSSEGTITIPITLKTQYMINGVDAAIV